MSGIEKDLSNPTMGELIVPMDGERREAIGILIAATILAVAKNPDISRRFTEQQVMKIKHALRRDSYEVLMRKIMALRTQNPGLLSEAFEKCGYKMRIDGNGNMLIDANAQGFSPVGELVPYEKFIKGEL